MSHANERHVGQHNGGWTEENLRVDGLRFADIDGDGIDDYVWIEPKSGAPTVFVNSGVEDSDSLGWKWNPLNGGDPIAEGIAPRVNVMFGDIDGDVYDDYLDLSPDDGVLKIYLNDGKDKDSKFSWKFKAIDQIETNIVAKGHGRFADIDGDGHDDFIYLEKDGRTKIYRTVWDKKTFSAKFERLTEADGSGINQSADEIDLVDINGDGKADYVWTHKLDGRMKVWHNQCLKKPTWHGTGVVADEVGTSGANIRYAKMQSTGRADYVAVDPVYGSIAAWLNGCSDPVEPPDGRETPDPSKNEKHCFNTGVSSDSSHLNAAAEWFCDLLPGQQDGDDPFFFQHFKNIEAGEVKLTFEVFDDCKWKYDKDECMRYYQVPIDSCDCDSADSKKGASVKNNCINASIDPNFKN